MNINYGVHVNGLGLICANVVVPATPPPAQAAANFAGVWDTVASGENYTLILEVNGGDVTGYFGHRDPQYDGTLRGTLQSAFEFTYTYTQKNGGAGSGLFKMTADGNSIYGGGGASSGQKFTWTGNRRP